MQLVFPPPFPPVLIKLQSFCVFFRPYTIPPWDHHNGSTQDSVRRWRLLQTASQSEKVSNMFYVKVPYMFMWKYFYLQKLIIFDPGVTEPGAQSFWLFFGFLRSSVVRTESIFRVACCLPNKMVVNGFGFLFEYLRSLKFPPGSLLRKKR